MAIRVTVLALALTIGGGVSAALADEDAAHLCDAGAASPEDADLPQGASGTAFADLDPSDALEAACIEASARQPTKRRFLTHLGRLYAKRGQSRAALEAYRLAAGRGSAVAANNLGTMYARGEGVIEDQDRATLFYRRAAHRGLPSAMLTMAVRSRTGRGTSQSMASAFYWYELAHEAGVPVATNDLGVMYRDGYGVRANPARAAELFGQALESDPANPSAARNLARLKQADDPIRALALYAQAFHYGHADSADDVGRLLAGEAFGAPDPASAVAWYARGAEAGSVYATVSLADAYADGLGTDADPDAARALYRQAFEMALDEDAEWRIYVADRLAELPEAEDGAPGAVE